MNLEFVTAYETYESGDVVKAQLIYSLNLTIIADLVSDEKLGIKLINVYKSQRLK